MLKAYAVAAVLATSTPVAVKSEVTVELSTKKQEAPTEVKSAHRKEGFKEGTVIF